MGLRGAKGQGDPLPELRLCVECKQKFPLDHFYQDKRKGLYRRACKPCEFKRKKRLHSEDPTPERFLGYRWSKLCQVRRRRGVYVQKSLLGSAGIPFLMKLWEKQRGRCALTGLPMTWQIATREDIANGYGLGRNVSVDRIDNSRGYVKGNIRLICSQLNYMRGSLGDNDFILWCELVVRHNGPPPIGFEKEREHAQAMAGNDEDAGEVPRRVG